MKMPNSIVTEKKLQLYVLIKTYVFKERYFNECIRNKFFENVYSSGFGYIILVSDGKNFAGNPF